jgi:hypothetical protein
MPCLFCQREFDESQSRKRTREHVFAEWMSPYLRSPDGPGTQVRWNMAADRPEYNARSYQAYPVQQAVQGVCQECNSGWLSRIQTAAKPPLLAALKSPRKRTFSPSAQRAMSTWAFRAALVLGAKAGDAQIPAHHLHDFYVAQKPPDSSRIWMIATGHRTYTFLDHRIIKVRVQDGEPPPRANAFATLVSVGHVAFYVLCWTDIKPRDGIRKLFDEFPDAIAPIYPPRGPVVWPPNQILVHDSLDRLANVIGIWEQ